MSSRSETFQVELSLPHVRLDTFLRGRYPAVSRGAIQRLIEEGHIRVEGQMAKPTHRPRAGEMISVSFPEARPAEAYPEEIPLQVLHEDDQILVLNKQAGLVVHPAAGNETHTLVNALLHYCRGSLSGIGGVARPGIVHRIDKDTSGCLVVAKTDAAHLNLARQFAERQVHKSYQLIVCGNLSRERGEIRAAIARHPSHRKRMAVTRGGREAWTTYHVRRSLRGATLVEAILHTGRTHQIRVHFDHLGYPVVGDLTYGARQNKRLTELTSYVAPRMLLHAWKIEFRHPTSGQLLAMEAPVPSDFQDALHKLRSGGSD